MSDEFLTLAAALPSDQTVVQLMSPLPVGQGFLIVSPGLAREEQMRIVAVDESRLLVTVEREKPQPHLLMDYAVLAPTFPDVEGEPRNLRQLAQDVLNTHWKDDRGDCGGCDHQVEWPCDSAMLAQHVLSVIP